ncbi:MAG: amino acid adenylation domain-containing protein, partial [Acidobacteriota bacterium]|nr:amino acid adenylation domain-containing protein [Acidobacteriota bacterium]
MTNSLPGATAQSQLSGETYRFPVSFAQLRLWFLDQLSPGSTSYLIPWALRIRGPLDATALAASLNGIVARHEIFRTHFEATEGEAVQVVHAAAHLELTRHDLSHLEPSAAEQQARQWMQREAETPMSLDSAPLLRASLLQLGTQDHVLLLTTHHIIFDGWSRSILVRELDAFYRAARQGVEAALPEMPIQYADFAIWQQQNLTGEYLSRQLDYWKQQLAGIPASLEIPTDRPRPAVQTFNGHSLHFRLSAELTQQVKQCSQAESVTPFMLLLAVFQLLLARYTGQQDIVVGTPIANRTRPELEGIIGLFANTLTLRTRLEGDPTLRELLARVRETALAAYAHEETPFEQLVQELHPERSLSHSPLFQVLFSQRNTPGGSFHLDDLEVEFFAGSGDTSKYDLSLYLEEHSDGYHGKFEYNTDLYDKTTIERILGHYRQLLAEVLQDTSRPLSHYQILTAAERTQLLETWNATAQAYPEALCVHLLFEQQAAARPQAIAVATDEATITYAELNRRANQLAHLLLQLGVGTGQRVGLFLERSLAMFVGLLGVQKAGAAYVPLDPAYPVERIRATLEAAGVSCLVTMQDLLPLLAAPACPVLCLDENHATDHDRLAACPETNPQTPVTAEDSIYVIFTSGSTGKPKGVELKHRGVVNLLEWMRAELRFDEQGVFPALASFAFDMSVPELYLALVSGGKVALGRRHLPADGEALASFLRRHGATLVHATPTTWSLLLDAGYTGHEVIRCIGAEPLPAELFGRLMDAAPGVPLYNFYGPTETTVWSTYQRLTSRADRITIGRPLANTQVYLVDSEGHPVPIGVPGEILIGGDGVARCYLNQPELTAEKFIPDTFRGRPDARVYRTGDLGRYLPDGRIEFAGRIDHQVKVRGYRIELGEIETVLSQLEAVREAVVMAREDEDGDKRLVAYVVFHAGASLSVPEMRTWVKQNLPEYMVPAAVVVLERMPLSPNGKVDRKALPSPMAEAPVARQPMDGPVQEMIANVWAEVLKTGEITPESNFFELGGHSLLAAKVVARIRQALHVPLPLSVVFEAPTLAEMAARVAALVREDNTPVESPLVAMQSGEAAPLSFAQQRLWFLDQLQPGSSFYNVPMAMRLTGPLDRAALVRAIEAMMEHQPSLRTCFAVQGEQPVQIIVPSLPTPLTEVDLSDLPVAEREEKAQALVRAEAGSSFNLAVPPLFRVLLVRLAAEDHVFMINLHHAISDGWSLGVVTNELVLLYEAFRKGESSPLPPLPLTYADYAVWQKRYLEAGALERQLGYWRQHMAGAPLAIDLPTDRVRPVMQTFSGSKQVVLFPAHLLERLKELSRAQGATLFITLLTAFDVLLARYSGQYDIVIGTAIAGRHHAETEKLIGYFANTLVLRNQVPGNQTFQQLMHSVRETTLNAFANQDVPFEKLVEELNPPRDTSRSPLFQVMLIQQNAFQRGSTFGSLQSVPYSAASGAAKVDLILNVAEDQGRLRCALEYNTDLYNAETIDRMLENYGALLESAVQQPDIPVAELALQRAEDREQLLFGWNKTTREYPHFTTVHQLFEQQVWRAPHATAVICDDTRLTYQELNQQANQLAAMLRARGVRQGDRVGIYLERSVPMMVALLGVQKSGAAYIPLDPAYPAERLSLVVQDAEIAMMLTEERLLAGMPQFSGSVVCLDREAE